MAALFKLADALEQHAEELAVLESQNAGKPVKLTRNGDIPFAIDNLRFFRRRGCWRGKPPESTSAATPR